MELRTKKVEGITIHYRPGTSDENALTEVIERGCYRRLRDKFDVEAGESWLDLGANIGAFAIYCRIKGARATCYEPDQQCFKILRRNAPKFGCVNAAVTGHQEKELDFFTNDNVDDHYRGTIIKTSRYHPYGTIKNLYGAFLRKLRFDGVKMDIEGSEAMLLDYWLLPRCEKMVMEYHSGKDPSLKNFARRARELRKRFKFVKYPSEFDKAIQAGELTHRPFVDRLIFAWGAK